MAGKRKDHFCWANSVSSQIGGTPHGIWVQLEAEVDLSPVMPVRFVLASSPNFLGRQNDDSPLRFPGREVEGNPFHGQVKDILHHFNIQHSHDARVLQAVQSMKEAHLATKREGSRHA